MPISDTQHNAPAGKSQRLLDQLGSPDLNLASNLNLKNKNPHPYSESSPATRQIALEIERLSGGRFSLSDSRNFIPEDDDHYLFHTVKVYDAQCLNHFFTNVHQLEQLKERCCPYCSEPVNMRQIGLSIEDHQRYTAHRSNNKATFSERNHIGELEDIYLFECKVCNTEPYEYPYIWFLRDSPGTHGCWRCEERIQRQSST